MITTEPGYYFALFFGLTTNNSLSERCEHYFCGLSCACETSICRIGKIKQGDRTRSGSVKILSQAIHMFCIWEGKDRIDCDANLSNHP